MLGPMSTVLLATDGSDLATTAMARGVALLGPGHSFHALSVIPPAYVPAVAVAPMDSHPIVIDPTLEDEIEREDRAETSADLAHLRDLLDVPVTPIVETGEPGPTICAVASRMGAEVIVVGSHGHGWLQRVLLGSVSTHVLHHAPCAVLVMRLVEEPET